MSAAWPDVPAMLADEEGQRLVEMIHARKAWPYADASSPQMVAWETRNRALSDRLDRAKAKAAAKSERPSGDVAAINIPSTPNRWGALEADIDRAVAYSAAVTELQSAQDAHAAHQRRRPVPFTREQLDTARAVRTALGWWVVRKAMAKSVTVETGHSWPDLVRIDSILEVRA